MSIQKFNHVRRTTNQKASNESHILGQLFNFEVKIQLADQTPLSCLFCNTVPCNLENNLEIQFSPNLFFTIQYTLYCSDPCGQFLD